MSKFKFTRKEILLLTVPLVVLARPIFQAIRHDELDTKMRSLAGSNAIDCGSVSEARKSGPVSQREVEAFKAGKTFFSRDNNTEPPGSMGTVMTPQGEIYYLFYTRPNWFAKGKLWVMRGHNPKILTFAGGQQLKCERNTEVSTGKQIRLFSELAGL